MKILRGIGLVRLDPDEWREVRAKLLRAGYVARRESAGSRETLWTADGSACVGNFAADELGASWYYLDERVLPDLGEVLPDA